MVKPAEIIGERLDATVVNMRFVKPLDEELVLRLAGTHTALVTIEENAVAGGAGSAVHRTARQLRERAAHAHARHSRSLHRTRLARGLPGRRQSSIWPASRPPCGASGNIVPVSKLVASGT